MEHAHTVNLLVDETQGPILAAHKRTISSGKEILTLEIRSVSYEAELVQAIQDEFEQRSEEVFAYLERVSTERALGIALERGGHVLSVEERTGIV